FAAVLFVMIAGCISEITHSLPATRHDSGADSRAPRGTKVYAEVSGTLSCPKEFRARVHIWDDDFPLKPDFIGEHKPYEQSTF
ncbi:hypothetical protein PMAYCL1PPCAC_22606, partial [Pristionchus mayeri]